MIPMRYIFTNVIAAGPINWKAPLTAPGQPEIADCFMIFAGDDEGLQITDELSGPSASNLCKYAATIGHADTVVVGHSVEYHHGHLRAAMIPMGLDPRDGLVRTICTMFALTGHVPKFNQRKGWPTFAECCHHLGIERAGTESAEDNARNLVKVFRWMEKISAVPEPKIWKDRNA
jgi:hypothetical protein